jgi:hypothetical protein
MLVTDRVERQGTLDVQVTAVIELDDPVQFRVPAARRGNDRVLHRALPGELPGQPLQGGIRELLDDLEGVHI